MGASSLGIVLCLGVPWAITAAMKFGAGEVPVMPLHGSGVVYTISTLALVSLALFTILTLSRYRLMKVTGIALGVAYLSFITFAVMAELGYVYPNNYCAE